MLLLVATPCYGSENNKPSWWFNGTWYPLDRATASCGVLKFSGATLSGGFRSFLYSLEEMPISDFSVINSNDLVIIRATLKQKSRNGGEGLSREVEYLIIRHFGLDDLSLHVCPDLQQVQKDIDKNTTGNYYCSNQAFSRNKEEMWSR